MVLKFFGGLLLSAMCVGPAQAGTIVDKAVAVEEAIDRGDTLAAVTIMRSAFLEARQNLPVAIARLAYVTDTVGPLGRPEERGSHVFSSGETLRLFVEPQGLDLVFADGQYSVDYVISVQVQLSDGTPIMNNDRFGEMKIKSRGTDPGSYANLKLDLTDARAGNYIFLVKVSDQIGKDEATAALPFVVR